jgi:hypothetical protein
VHADGRRDVACAGGVKAFFAEQPGGGVDELDPAVAVVALVQRFARAAARAFFSVAGSGFSKVVEGACARGAGARRVFP